MTEMDETTRRLFEEALEELDDESVDELLGGFANRLNAYRETALSDGALKDLMLLGMGLEASFLSTNPLSRLVWSTVTRRLTFLVLKTAYLLGAEEGKHADG